MIRRASLAVVVLTIAMSTGVLQARSTTPGNVDVRTQIRHELNGLPYSTIWDWIEAETRPDGSVVLRGEVMKPSTKEDAEFRVRRIESVQNVINEIHVLPLSTFDNEIRMAVYRSLFNRNSTLAGYSLGANPTIHIIVENGHVTLKGIVANAMDRQLAEVAVNSVFGVLNVDNQLQLDSQQAS